MFQGCSGLVSVTIPVSLTYIDDASFSACNSLTDVYYAGTKEQWNSIWIQNGNDSLTNANIHFGYAPLTNILTLPASLTTIESQAFACLTHVDAISIPATVASIADDAFEGSDIVIIAPVGSYAATWAAEHGFEVRNP